MPVVRMNRRCAVRMLPLLLCLGLTTRRANAIAEDAMLNQCSELKAQEHLDLNEMMGKWYVVEVIEHKSDSRQVGGSGNSGTGATSPARVLIDACPIVKLKSVEARAPSTREGSPRISLLWEEDAGTLEYTFWISNTRGPGVWNSDTSQNGTLADKPSYRQFVGTAHVMKAVAAHMILTFCTRNTDGQKFSVLLGREHKLPKIDLKGVHKLLERRNLHLLSIRESCANGATALSFETPLIGLVLTCAWTLLQKLVN